MKNSLCKAMIPIFLTGLMIISSIIFSSSQAKGEAAADLLGRYSCSKVKALLESAPEEIFKMWANSGQFGSNSAKATEIIMRGELQGILSHIGDINTLIQGLEELASGDPKNVAKIFADWALGKTLTMLGTGVPGAVWTVCKELNTFAIALNAEIVDLNVKMFANFAESDPKILARGGEEYFIKNWLDSDSKVLETFGQNKTKAQRLALLWDRTKRRAALAEYAKVKLGQTDFPPPSEWNNNWNRVRSVTRSMLNEVNSVVKKRKKIRQLQGVLRAQLDDLKTEQTILTTFQALRDQVRAMTCQDTASKECLDNYNAILSAVGSLTLDAGDIKSAGSGILDGLNASTKALYGDLERIDQDLENDYKTKIKQYCANITNDVKSLTQTITLAQASNPGIAARAVQAKGYMNQACGATTLTIAKNAADKAQNAAAEAVLLSNLLPLVPSDLDKYKPPAPMDFSSAESKLSSIEKSLAALEKSIKENFKKWEKFRNAAAQAKATLKKLGSACGKNDLIKGIAASVAASRIEGKINSIESQVPDIRYENNTLGTIARRTAEIRNYLTGLKGKYQESRKCLADCPDIGSKVAQARQLLKEAQAKVKDATRHANAAVNCYTKLKNKNVCSSDDDCPEGKICKDGKCVDHPQHECTGDSDCPEDHRCKDGKCVKACGKNKKLDQGVCVCIAGYEDVNGICVPACQPGEKRNANGDCVVVCGPHEKNVDNDNCVCVEGYEYVGDDCIPVCGDHEVRSANGRCVCAPGYTRDSKTGECLSSQKPGCQRDEECPQGYVCHPGSGKCVSPFDQSYTDYTNTLAQRDDDRSQNQADQATTDQGIKKGDKFTGDDLGQDLDDIQDDISKKCKDDSGCPSGFVCHNGECIKKPGCTPSSGCPAGQVCKNGHCVKVSGCSSDSDCPKGQVCKNGSCVDKTPVKQATLTISPANKAVVINETVNFKAIFTGTDGTSQDVTSKAQWSPSSSLSKGTIGVYTVTANHQGLTATAQVTVVKEKGMDDITVNKKTITVNFWDHGQEDGDMIDILINGKVVFPGITLKKAHQSRTITMNADVIVVGFRALNVGTIAPNTATVTFSSVTAGKQTQKYTLKKDQKANMNVTYKP